MHGISSFAATQKCSILSLSSRLHLTIVPIKMRQLQHSCFIIILLQNATFPKLYNNSIAAFFFIMTLLVWQHLFILIVLQLQHSFLL